MAELAAGEASLGLVGEAGTGKTHLARQCHLLSHRRTAPFERIDLRRMPGELVESELFGFVRSTILSRHGPELVPGALQRAARGTCLIEGIDTIPLATQETLLCAMTEGEVVPVGSHDRVPHHARVIIEVRGRELSHRRGTVVIAPLRELLCRALLSVESLSRRRDDMLPLAEHFLTTYAAQWGMPCPELHHNTLRRMKRAHWPDNIRSLAAAMATALMTSQGKTIVVHHLPPQLFGRPEEAAEAGIAASALDEVVLEKLQQFFTRLGEHEVRDLYSTVMAKVERPLIALVLESTQWNQVKAARMLGINRNTLRARIAKLGLRAGRTTI
jgi:two-component system, NtrC family, nitrogen regulation response regulator GlnG